MKTRERILSEGWYPETKKEIISVFSDWSKDYNVEDKYSDACIIPHAGWYYSGKLAFAGIGSIKKNKDLIIVCGGHLGETSAVLAAYEDEFETPLGNIRNDLDFLDKINNEIYLEQDVYQDNTVEIQLPIIRYFFPDAKILYLRAPLNQYAEHLGDVISQVSHQKGIEAAFVASTDLTHYGPNYSFTDKGTGEEAVDWVKNVNDSRIINAMLEMNTGKILEYAINDKSACSAGAAAAACSFSKKADISKSKLIDYYTSYDIYPSSSFVGYAALAYYS